MRDFNLNFSFNEDLREVLECPEDVEEFISIKSSELKASSRPREKVKILGEVAPFVRILGKVEEAALLLSQAMELIDRYNLEIKLWASNGLRLAHCYQWLEQYEVAEEMFINIIEACQECDEIHDYLHFAIQHYGKMHFDAGDYSSALECFEDALEIRKEM